MITINNIEYSADEIHSIEDTELRDFLIDWIKPTDQIILHTSGSTGKPKEFVGSKAAMIRSAMATIDVLNIQPFSTALLCMSLKFIAAKMMVVRAIIGKLNLITTPISSSPLSNVSQTIDFAAFVPIQLHNSLQQCPDKLSRIGKVIVGGGAVNPQLEDDVQSLPCQIYATYGMTEFYSHIALRHLNGKLRSQYYSPLHGVSLSQDKDQCLIIHAPYLHPLPLKTNDIVEFSQSGGFKVIGRIDNVVCSGGIKLHIEQIEEKLAPHINVPFALSSLEDRVLGERLVLCLQGDTDESMLHPLFRSVLTKYEVPKQIITLPSIPLTPSGKIARKLLKDIIKTMP